MIDKNPTPNSQTQSDAAKENTSPLGNNTNASIKSSSTSKPISQTMKVDKKELSNDSPEKRGWLKKTLYIFIIFLAVCIGGMVLLSYYGFIPINFHWKNGTVLNINSTTTGQKAASSTTLSSIQTSKGDSLSAQNILDLEQKIQNLEQRIIQYSNAQAHNRENNQISSLINIVGEHVKQQQQQMAQLEQRVEQFSILINRWKKRLSDPDLLIDNLYNHLQLIQSQMILNYSPQLLAKQIEEVDALVAELSTDELNTLRLELQILAKKLDLKPSVPLDSWLRELELAEKLIPVWLQEHNSNKRESSISISGAYIESDALIQSTPNSFASENTEENLDSLDGFWFTVKNFILNRLENAFSLSKKAEVKDKRDDTNTINHALSNEQISRYLRERFELLRLSILSRNWDALRHQSTEMNIWVEENLPAAHKILNRKLSIMSQYKPVFVTQSLSRAITMVENYRHALRQQSQGNSYIPLVIPQTKNTQHSSTTIKLSTESSIVSSSTTITP